MLLKLEGRSPSSVSLRDSNNLSRLLYEMPLFLEELKNTILTIPYRALITATLRVCSAKGIDTVNYGEEFSLEDFCM